MLVFVPRFFPRDRQLFLGSLHELTLMQDKGITLINRLLQHAPITGGSCTRGLVREEHQPASRTVQSSPSSWACAHTGRFVLVNRRASVRRPQSVEQNRHWWLQERSRHVSRRHTAAGRRGARIECRLWNLYPLQNLDLWNFLKTNVCPVLSQRFVPEGLGCTWMQQTPEGEEKPVELEEFPERSPVLAQLGFQMCSGSSPPATISSWWIWLYTGASNSSEGASEPTTYGAEATICSSIRSSVGTWGISWMTPVPVQQDFQLCAGSPSLQRPVLDGFVGKRAHKTFLKEEVNHGPVEKRAPQKGLKIACSPYW